MHVALRSVESTRRQFRTTLETGINALLEKQRSQICLAKIDGLEKFDEKLKTIEAGFRHKGSHGGATTSQDAARNKKAVRVFIAHQWLPFCERVDGGG